MNIILYIITYSPLLLRVHRNAAALLSHIIVYGSGSVLFGTGHTLNTASDEWKFMASTIYEIVVDIYLLHVYVHEKDPDRSLPD